MSYKQIIRRAGKIFNATVRDAFRSIYAEELDAFDQELAKSARKGSDEGRTEEADAASGAERRRPAAGGEEREKQQRAREQRTREQQARQEQEKQRRERQEQEKHAGGGRRAEGRRKPGEKDTGHYLAVLGLAPGASVAEMRLAYRALMLRHHPDRVATAPAAEQRQAAERAKVITEAYQILQRRLDFR